MYERQIATAKRLIAKYGEQVVLSTISKAQNTDQPWKQETGVIETATVNAVFFTVGLQDKKSMAFAQNSDYPVGSILAYFIDPKIEVSTATTVTRKDGTVLTIKTIDLLQPNSEKVLYTVVFNKASA